MVKAETFRFPSIVYIDSNATWGSIRAAMSRCRYLISRFQTKNVQIRITTKRGPGDALKINERTNVRSTLYRYASGCRVKHPALGTIQSWITPEHRAKGRKACFVSRWRAFLDVGGASKQLERLALDASQGLARG